MKKLVLILTFIILLSGCGKKDKQILKDLSDKVSNYETYLMKGTLKIYRDDNVYTYDVESSYMKDDNFRVSLTNKTNNHEQIILRNSKGVYVITPSLGKSFKFQSEWPYNNSQIYLLQPILSDLENDKDIKFEKNKNGYIYIAKVNYVNDSKLTKQKVYLSKDLELKKVEVLDNDGNVIMRLKVTKFEDNNNFDDKYFEIDDNYTKSKSDTNVKNNKKEEDNKSVKTKTTSTKDEVLYPMYVPIDTKLSSQDAVNLDDGFRTILTFTGDSPFTLVQSSLDNSSVKYIDGDPTIVDGTIGALSSNSVAWISDDKEYYLTSNTVSSDELLKIADSLTVAEVGK